ncbi:MAG: bifunctional phosphoribosylaminoimidazolecarboxamide formyltransferase/IMP cyclohydrolase [Candidatus Lokiarchaeota archaeon]|nr:bifunctional phosphoribosylaminoimidazolecarboxamide formyltransferase/IMP cyclohydrolase [Candidatus Lokiarchaeota archaeon]
MAKIKRALVSVFDKSGIVDFAKALQEEFGVEILSTGGTGRILEKNGIKIIKVSKYTNSPEMFDGRVKTLHPRIEGGILMRQELEKDIEDAKSYDVPPIDMVVCNLYPFWDAIKNEENTTKDNLEMIDIGGPTMIRAAAKNYHNVTVIADAMQYNNVLEELRKNNGDTTLETRQRLAQHVFETMSRYDGTIAQYLDNLINPDAKMPEFLYRAYKKVQDCRYGENWDQDAAFYRDMNAKIGIDSFKQIHGKKISFNNFLDIDACVQTLLEFGPDNYVCSIFKHTTPNGVAIDFKTQLEATKHALSCDPLSAFGGIYGFNKTLKEETADFLINDKNMFVEVIIAPDYEENALKILKKKKNMRILTLPNFYNYKEDFYSRPELRSTLGGMLVQDYDTRDVIKEWDVKSKRPVSDSEKYALIFAYKACKWAKSNSAVFAKEYSTGVYTIGIGAGQQSRVHVVKLAAQKAEEFGHDLKDSVMGTDSFFPFPDGLEAAAEVGCKAILNPGGSIRDNLSIEKSDELGISLVFCGKRVFRH